MVAVFLFLIFLYLFRYPIIKWINKIPDPPVIELGECQVKGKGQLKIGHVHLTPSSGSGSIIVTFTTNLPTNNLIAIQYGINQDMEFETFASVAEKNSSGSLYPYVYYASLLIVHPGRQYFYRVLCAATHSKTYSFHSWRAGSGWSPSIALVSGKLSERTVNTLKLKKHQLSLVTHIDSYTPRRHTTDYLDTLQEFASEIPSLLLPGGEAAEESTLFPLPGAEWPVTEHTFYTLLGPLIVVGFRSDQLTSQISRLARVFDDIAAARETRPWLLVVSLDESFCLPTKTISPRPAPCQKLFQLFIKHKVDLYVTGLASGYHRTWPIASDGSPLSTYHNAQGFVSVALGLREGEKLFNSLVTAQHLMRNDSSVQNTYVTIELVSPGSLCSQVINPHSQVPVDQFCIDKVVQTNEVRHSMFSSQSETYDMKVWLVLVIILTVVFAGLLIFRRAVYTGVCKYMESNGGVPLYEGKLLTV
ncbi:hypothetical protein EB796_015112 [Bugula neritina]|uniref:Uncharacterized protein n=1 Tax=Bugula neritina TaxID=10212 RepID=A0A7J7JJQ8_BUGNE|nr:hypothetical protein EB796_015112 [Bugula neritina]